MGLRRHVLIEIIGYTDGPGVADMEGYRMSLVALMPLPRVLPQAARLRHENVGRW
jgi:hypothetical protein